jgi:pSer/pThr/pTyr-binding forkhead associated (FHA) protein
VPEPLANRVTTRDSTPPSPPPAPTLVSSSARPAPPAPALSGIKGVEVLSADKTLKRVGVGEFAIGRSVEAGIRLDTTDREVSRSHALLSVKPDRVEIEDRSQNGTFVNNERITGRKALQDGDQVRCGSITMTIRFTRGR